MPPDHITRMERTWDIPADTAQPVAGEFIAHEQIGGVVEYWEITKVEILNKGGADCDYDVARCTCLRRSTEEPQARCYIVSDILFTQVDKVLSDLRSRGIANPSPGQVLASIHNVEYPNN